MKQQEKMEIYIFGAGFAGLSAAVSLSRRLHDDKSVNITLIDQKSVHLYTPLLYEIGTAYHEHDTKKWEHSVEQGSAVSLRKILTGKKMYFLQDSVEHLDLQEKKVQLKKNGTRAFDYAVIALGSESSDFGVPGIKSYALRLKTIHDALTMRRKVAHLVESMKNGDEKRTIVIGGGGYTGVELAAELYGQTQKLLREYTLSKDRISLLIVEAANTILPGLSDRATRTALARLDRLGIRLKLNHRITDVKPDHILVDGKQRIPHDIFVWTGGVSCSEVEQIMGQCEVDSRHRMMVNEFLQLNGHERIFAIGDNACPIDPKTKKPAAMLAQLAIAQGERAAYNLAQHFYGKLMLPYEPKIRGVMVPLGGKNAIAQIGRFHISGVLGWFVKKMVDLRYFLTILPPRKALASWWRGARLYAKND